MLTEDEIFQVSMFMVEEDIDKSPAGQEKTYQDLLKRYERCRNALCAGLRDKRIRQLEELLELRHQLEFERNIHYLNRAFDRGKRKSP